MSQWYKMRKEKACWQHDQNATDATAQTALLNALNGSRPDFKARRASMVTGGCFACLELGGTSFANPRRTWWSMLEPCHAAPLTTCQYWRPASQLLSTLSESD